MLFKKYRVNRWKRLYGDALQHATNAEVVQEPRHVIDAYWRTVMHYGRKLYRYEQKEWYKKAIKDFKQADPYGAFYSIPKILFDLVQRCQEYWSHGYNVWSADTTSIVEQTAHAANLAKSCMEYWENDDCCEFPQEQITEFFKYVADNVVNWGD